MLHLDVLALPFLAALVLTGIHSYLGIHVISRRVIFVDIALAQIAALGATIALAFDLDPGSTGSYFFSLGCAVAAAVVFALTRTRHERVPQEAIIGLTFAVASSLAILIADAMPHGAEHLRDLLAGSIVLVTPKQVIKTAIFYAVVGTFHMIFRRRFLLISMDPERAYESGMNVPLWDFFFYLSFAVVITSSVQIAGVFLVFTYLIAPAVFAVMFADTIAKRLAIAWVVGAIASAVGLVFSYDRPSGPSIICVFAFILMLGGIVRYVLSAQRRRKAILVALAYTAGLAGLAIGGYRLTHSEPAEHEPHPHGEPEHAIGQSVDDLLRALQDEHANVGADAARQLRQHSEPRVVKALQDVMIDPKAAAHIKEEAATTLGALGDTGSLVALKKAYAAHSSDEWVELRIAQAIATLGDRDGLDKLLDLAQNADAGLVKSDALLSFVAHIDATLDLTMDDDHKIAALKAWAAREITFDKAKSKFSTNAK